MAGTRSALLLAAFEFEDEKFRQLRAPSHDAEALATVLGDDAIGGFDVKTLINQPWDLVNQEIEAFCSDRTPDDLLLLYFSCHGIKDATGRLYFAMANTKFDRLRSTGVSATFVSEQMEYSRSRRIALLLDCCYSGAFVKGLRARASEDVQVKDHFEGRGRVVITASRATEYAFEADDVTVGDAQPSLFTGAVVTGLATGRADRNGDGVVTVDELYDYVFDEVRGKAAGQTPGRWVDLEGELIVARNPHGPAAAAVPPPPVAAAVPSTVAAVPATPLPSGPSPFPAATVVGAVLVLAAIFTPLFKNDRALIEDLPAALGPAVAVAISLTAAALLRGPGDSRLAHALAAGLLPAVVVQPIALLASATDHSYRLAVGGVLLCAGCVLLAIAGLRGAARMARAVSALDRPASADVVMAVVAAGLGIGAALAYGRSTPKDLAYGTGLSTLAWRLTALCGLAAGLRYWAVASRLVPERAVRPVAALLGLASLGLFAAYYNPEDTPERLVLAALAVVTVAAAVIPLTAVLAAPRHLAAVLLGSWAVAQGALLARTPARWWPYAGALVLAGVLWRRSAPSTAGT
jgi:hypothetical protein